MDKFDLEERLIDFAVLIIELSNEFSDSKAGNHMRSQIVRSGISPALNYGEAQSGESKKDFIHKMKIALKELRETFINLKIVYKAKIFQNETKMKSAMKENNELISIFVKSVETAQNNIKNEKSLI